MPDLTPPARGFSIQEFEQRTARAQRMMAAAKLDCIMLTTEPEIRYFSGFLTQFWLSPTRPWFMLLPLDGKPIAVIPTIGEVGMRQTWIEDIRCWSSPQPGDDGVSLLLGAIEGSPRRFGRIGVGLSEETHLRMPAADFARVQERTGHMTWVDTAMLLKRLFAIKSSAEVDKIRYACQIAAHSFAQLPQRTHIGDLERDAVHAMRIDLLQRGVDHVPFIVSASGPDGYDNIIMGPVDRSLDPGDVMIIDTGAIYDGYYCDFDRNYVCGHCSDRTKQAYDTVYRAIDAGFAAARPGATTSDLWRAMWRVLAAGGAEGETVGRLGHGLGMQLTEWPSNTGSDNTTLEAGMVITLEPGMSYDGGKQMVLEENIVITDSGAEMLTPRAPQTMAVIGQG